MRLVSRNHRGLTPKQAEEFYACEEEYFLCNEETRQRVVGDFGLPYEGVLMRRESADKINEFGGSKFVWLSKEEMT